MYTQSEEPVSNINAIFEELKATSGKNDKLAILTREKNNKLFKQVIELALNPFTLFYIKKIPAYGHAVWENYDEKPLPWALKELEKLSTRSLTGNAAINHLETVLNSLSADDAKVVVRIISKDLDCGVDTAVNKVWKGLIPETPIMLCEPYDEKLVAKIEYPAIAQLKADGMRFNAIVSGGAVQLISRKGTPLNLLGALDLVFIKAAKGDDVVFDGELLVYDEDMETILPRKTGNGILNKANKGTITRMEANRVTFNVWDIIPLNEWVPGGKGTWNYSRRYAELKARFTPELLIEQTIVYNLQEAEDVFNKYLAQGNEGIILKSGLNLWEDKRSKTCIKFKAELECDLEVVAWEEGIKKNVGKLGALKCQSSDGKVVVSVGTGLSDDQRKTLKPKDVVGRIVSVLYNARISDKRGGPDALFLPRFVEFRDDKDKADHSKTIK